MFDWIGSILTGLSLLLAVYILLRDSTKERRSQAAKVTFELPRVGRRLRTVVYNHSDQIVSGAVVLVRKKDEYLTRKQKLEIAYKGSFAYAMVVTQVAGTEGGALLPQTPCKVDQSLEITLNRQMYDVYLEFTDASGVWWQRNWDGQLKEIPRLGSLAHRLHRARHFVTARNGKDSSG